MAAEGVPVDLVKGVFAVPERSQAYFSVSRNGVLAWRDGRAALRQLTWFDRTGKVLGTAGPTCFPDPVRLSPDENHVIFYTPSGHAGLSVAEANRSGFLPLPGVASSPIWAPDSSDILYARKDGDSFEIVRRAAAGGPEQAIAPAPRVGDLTDLSADGKVLLYRGFDGAGPKLYAIRLGRESGAEPEFVAEALQGSLSPDGRWLAYSPARGSGSGKREVYVQPFPARGLRAQITTDGGQAPVWRGDGKEILYLNGPTICSVRVEVKGGTLRASPPQALFNVRAPTVVTGGDTPFAVTRDGSRILFAQAVEQPSPHIVWVKTAWDSKLPW